VKKYIAKKSACNETGSIPDMQAIHRQSQPHQREFKRKRNAVLRVAIATLLGGVMIVEPAFADDVTKQYKIPAQSLNNALMKFAADSNLELIFSADTVRNLNAKSLDGTMTPEQALGQLLQGSGYTYRFIDKHTVTLEKAPEQLNKANPTTLKALTVTGKANYDPNDPYDKHYAATNSTTATKTDTPIMETPVSIQVVPRAVMDDQQAISVMDAMRNVSGAQPAGGQYYDTFMLRGFNGATAYRDGLRQSSITNLETANLERVEVLKGPASVLFGRAEPGGILNLVTKKPLDTPYYSLQQQFGSYDLYRTTADATGPLTSDKSLLYRMNLAYKTNNSFRDFVSQDHIFFAPSLTWRPTDRFETNLNLEYQHDDFGADGGGSALIPAIGNRPANIPFSRYLGDPVVNQAMPNTQEKILLGFNWSYKFTDKWKLQNRFQYVNSDWHQTIITAASLAADSRTLNRRLWNIPAVRDIYSTNLDLTGKFDTGFLHHDVLAGFDYMRFMAHDGGGWSGASPLVTSIDIYNPVYGNINPAALNAQTNNFYWNSTDSWYGAYFQDQISLFDDKLHIMGGGRQDWAEQASGQSATTFDNIQLTKTSNDYFSPRVGVLYQPWSWISLYGNYVESFGSGSGLSATGTPFKPQIADQYEAGIKTELLDKRLTSTLAYFDITKSNILTPVPGTNFSDVIGEVHSRGIELDVAGQITENWSVIGNYAYTDAYISKDNTSTTAGGGNQGHPLASVANHSSYVWTKYDVTKGRLSGLNFGTGVAVAGQKQGDNANTFQLPGFVRWDASVGYAFKNGPGGSRISTQLNVYNLLDKAYYLGSSNRFNIQPAQPITFVGSVKIEF
jgi:iron complex outermembrane receptor protein